MKRFSPSLTSLGTYLGIGLLATIAAGCVDQESSLSLRGIVQYQGQSSNEEVQCGSEDNQETRQRPSLTCTTDLEAGSVETFLPRATVNISTLENRGQLGPPFPSFSDVEFCDLQRSEYLTRKYSHASFFTTLDAINNLEDSTNVGAEGQGGGQGGFEGLRLNQNAVQLKQIHVRFPNVSGTSGGNLQLDKDIQTAGLMESTGGALALQFQLFKQEEVPFLDRLHQRLVLQRTGLSQYNDQARRTTVTVLVEIWLEGETLAQTTVESNRLQFPVEICGQGCQMTPSCNFVSEN